MIILKPLHLPLILVLGLLLSFQAVKPPTDEAGRPLIVKSGTIDVDLVETTPIVFDNKVYRFEYVRKGYWGNQTGDSYFRFVNRETGAPTASFAKGFHLGSAFVRNETVYVTAVDIWDGEDLRQFRNSLLQADTLKPACRNCKIAKLGPHPMKSFSAEILGVRTANDNKSHTLVVKNAGTQEWTREQVVKVGTARPSDRGSGLCNES